MDKHEVLKKYWGYDSFRQLQDEIIDSVLAGNDTIGLMPTGGGKSITFQVPAMMLPGLTIVVTPLISLMKDQVDNLMAHNIRAYCLHSGMTRAESRLVIDRCRLGKVKMLYLSPERLQNKDFLMQLRSWDVSLIVVDEAHCISQWGYDFRPSYLGIKQLREIFPDVNILALTATATHEVVEDICRQLDFRKNYRKFVKSFSRSNLSYIVRYDDYKYPTLLKVLNGTSGTAIVYVRSRVNAAKIAGDLVDAGFSAEFYHAGLDPSEKTARQNRWKEGKTRIIVATTAFGMGIDKADVRTVVHYDLPSSLEEYYQEAGRAGRDGLPSFAVVIYNKRDRATLSRRLAETFPSKEYICKVYEAACNFLNIAIGDGYDCIYDFNFSKFCQQFKFHPSMAHSALQILGRAGYMEFIEETQSLARVMVIADRREFYSLRLEPQEEAIFNAILRLYTGLFADYVYIREEHVALNAGVQPDQVYQTLLKLQHLKVISFIPKRLTPYVYLPTSREEPRYILLPKAVYADRRANMEKRIEAMKRFVFDQDRCRSSMILEYFGETGAADCGKCDFCRNQRKTAQVPEQSLLQYIQGRVRQGGSVLLSQILPDNAERRAHTLGQIRHMQDAGAIRLTPHGADYVISCGE